MPLSTRNEGLKADFQKMSPQGSICTLESDRVLFQRVLLRHFSFVIKFKAKKRERRRLRLSGFLTDFKLTIFSEPLTKVPLPLSVFACLSSSMILYTILPLKKNKKPTSTINCLQTQSIRSIGLFLAAKTTDPTW